MLKKSMFKKRNNTTFKIIYYNDIIVNDNKLDNISFKQQMLY